MLFSIVAVGNEVISGTTTNANTPWLADSLESIGHSPALLSVVPDSESNITNILNSALALSDIVVLTGGLGPTPDDLTKESVAKSFKLELQQSETAMCWMKSFFEKRSIDMPSSNLKQALVPLGARSLKNTVGTAPGIIIEIEDKWIILLPGPPNELQPMWRHEVLPFLPVSKRFFQKDFYVLGMSESTMADRIMPLLKRETEPHLAPYAGIGQIRLRISAHADSYDDFSNRISEVERKIEDRLCGHLFNHPMTETLIRLLIDKKLTISTSESCTGGLISKQITDVPGASACFAGGAVTYSNESKTGILGVNPFNLEQFGAVSEQVASEMAEGARIKFGSDIALSATGIAGPSGGTDEKPVGLVYMGFSTPHETKVFKEVFTGDRNTVRVRTAMFIMWQTIERILKEL